MSDKRNLGGLIGPSALGFQRPWDWVGIENQGENHLDEIAYSQG